MKHSFHFHFHIQHNGLVAGLGEMVNDSRDEGITSPLKDIKKGCISHISGLMQNGSQSLRVKYTAVIQEVV